MTTLTNLICDPHQRERRATVKAGDAVMVAHPLETTSTGFHHTVTRVTKCQIILDNGMKFWRSGKLVGGAKTGCALYVIPKEED